MPKVDEMPDFDPVHRVPRWLSEQDVVDAMKGVLIELVAERGNPAKALAWDVSIKFRRAIEGMGQPGATNV